MGEGELTTLAADTASTDTTYSDTTATDSEETYAYQVKAVRGQARSQGSNKVIEAPEPPATAENLAPSKPHVRNTGGRRRADLERPGRRRR